MDEINRRGASALYRRMDSPSDPNLKFVCSFKLGAVGFRSLPEQNTTRKPLGCIVTAGNTHLSGVSESSLNDHPARLTRFVLRFFNSTQSWNSLFSSRRPLTFTAT